jgi:hypothetical protein
MEGFTTGSRGEVPGKTPVIREDDNYLSVRQ